MHSYNIFQKLDCPAVLGNYLALTFLKMKVYSHDMLLKI